MRSVRAALLLSVVALALPACGKSSTSPSQEGLVQFRLDQNTCTNVLGTQVITVSFFIDGVLKGTAQVSVGTVSPTYPVTAGSHVASASLANTSIRWDNLTISVPAKTTFTVVLGC